MTWPDLPPKELVANLSALVLPHDLTEEDITKPTPEKMRVIYEALVVNLTGISLDENEQVPFQQMGGELDRAPEAANLEVRVLYGTARLAAAAGIQDFSIRRDILAPRRERVIKSLSGIVNFLLFREERLENFQRLCTEAVALLERREAAALEHQQLQHELMRLRAASEHVSPALRTLQEETAVLQERLWSHNMQQAAMSDEARRIAAQSKELDEAIQVVRQHNSAAQQQVVRLRGKIVQSPRKLRKLIEDMNENVEEHRTEIADAERRCRELTARIELLAKLKKEVLKCTQQMEATHAELTKAKDARRNAKDLDARLADAQRMRIELDNSKVLLERKIDAAKEKTLHMREALSNQIAAAQAAYDEALAERSRFDKDATQIASQIHHNQLETDRIERAMEEERRLFDEELADYRDKHERLRLQVNAYHQSLFAAMGLTTTAS